MHACRGVMQYMRTSRNHSQPSDLQGHEHREIQVMLKTQPRIICNGLIHFEERNTERQTQTHKVNRERERAKMWKQFCVTQTVVAFACWRARPQSCKCEDRVWCHVKIYFRRLGRKSDLDPYAENNKSKSFYCLVYCHQSTANGYVRGIFPDYQSEQVYLGLAQSLIL